MPNNLYYNKQLLSGICKVPRLTQSEYDALTTKPEFWILKDSSGSYKRLNAIDVEYDLGSGQTSDVQTELGNVGYAVNQLNNNKYDKSALGTDSIKADRNVSRSTSRRGYWAMMANSGSQYEEENYPVLPTSNEWWHVLSMDWAGGTPDDSPITDWCSQLAIPTLGSSDKHLYFRYNSAAATDIDQASWTKVPTSTDLTICDEILSQPGITTSSTAYNCDWHKYAILFIEALQYGNVRATIVVPYGYFLYTADQAKVFLKNTIDDITYFVHQNGNGSIKAWASKQESTLSLRIYGFIKR